MAKQKFVNIIVLILGILCYLSAGRAFAQIQVPGIIHLHTEISDGLYSLKEVVEKAKNKGIEIVIFTDHALMKWEYSPLPFWRKFIRKKVELPSVLRYGAAKYLKEIEELASAYPKMVIIAGLETSPFYWWEGGYFKKNLCAHNWHKNLLVIGLPKPEDYKNLPLLSNRRTIFDQYHGDEGARPYQDLIDYVNEKGGLIYWSAPEVKTEIEKHGVKFLTLPYYEDLLTTDNYTGFAILFEGYRKIGGAGGIWDTLLNEYCQGKRKRPIWAIGEVDYHYEGEAGGKFIDTVENVFLIKDKNRQSILNALKKGNSYSLWRTKDYRLVLERFVIVNKHGRAAFMGDEIPLDAKPLIEFEISCSDGSKRNIKVTLIRSGKLIKEFILATPDKISFKDDYFKRGEKIYYRLQVDSEYPNMLFSNPIFVQFVKEK